MFGLMSVGCFFWRLVPRSVLSRDGYLPAVDEPDLLAGGVPHFVRPLPE